MTSKVNNSDFWEQRYKEETAHWDIGEVAPAFVKYFSRTGEVCKPRLQNVAVLGCGRGHDAFYIASCEPRAGKEGFASRSSQDVVQVHAFDFSESAINYCNKVKEENNVKNIHFHQANIFELVKDKKWKGYFDLVIEHTCFCAIDPNKRSEYIELVKYLLKPNGKLVGLFFMRDKELGGPPYGSTPKIIKDHFKKDFKEIVELHPESCLHSNLNGEEWFGVFETTS